MPTNDARRRRKSPKPYFWLKGEDAPSVGERVLPSPLSEMYSDAQRRAGEYTPPEPIELTN